MENCCEDEVLSQDERIEQLEAEILEDKALLSKMSSEDQDFLLH